MKVVILAGGFGTRISEESYLKPKPMIEIGEKPILWHIMKCYAHHGFSDFIVCLGYKGYSIKEYFDHYFLHESDVTFNFQGEKASKTIHRHSVEPWQVTLVNTGLETMTGGRVKMIQPYVGDETFMLTYGDGLTDLDFRQLLSHHRSHGRLATVTTVQPAGRFGALDLSDTGQVAGFREKPRGDGGWINGGFFVLEPSIFDYIAGPSTVMEREPLQALAADGELMAYRHEGFWFCMDTLRDKLRLEEMWKSGTAPWKAW